MGSAILVGDPGRVWNATRWRGLLYEKSWYDTPWKDQSHEAMFGTCDTGSCIKWYGCSGRFRIIQHIAVGTWKLMLHNRKLLGQSEACRSSEVLEVACIIYSIWCSVQNFNFDLKIITDPIWHAASTSLCPSLYALEWLRMGPSCDLYAAGVPGTLKKLGVNGPTPTAWIVAPEMEWSYPPPRKLT